MGIIIVAAAGKNFQKFSQKNVTVGLNDVHV